MTSESASAYQDRRRRTYETLAPRLAALSDEALAALLAGSSRANMHGNQSGVIDVEGAKVFAKQIALTDIERTAENEGSTANLFDLPVFYQYGVGSAGFGAWRELSACLRASAWALSGECPYFPLVYHWRVMPRATPRPLSASQQARLQLAVDYWDHAEAVRARLEAIFAASASIVLLLEHATETVQSWLTTRLTDGGSVAAVEPAILRIHDQWRAAAAFMNDRGMLHFDLHQHNVLTDDEQVYVADFGLAICDDFVLSPAERTFFETHGAYDRCYVPWAFTGWIAPPADAPTLTPALHALVSHYAPIAGIFGGFIKALGEGSKTTPYPGAALEEALAAQSGAR